ncbi:MAG: aminoglycoside phosphotransferase family protein [Thermoplasmata archaeon]
MLETIGTFKQSIKHRNNKVYKAIYSVTGGSVIVKESNIWDVTKEYKQLDLAFKFFDGKITIPRAICIDKIHKRLVMTYIENKGTLERFHELNYDYSLLYKVVDVLVEIHSLKDQEELSGLQCILPFSKLKYELYHWKKNIKDEFEAEYEEKLEKAIEFILSHTSSEDDVPSHGDFGLDNVLITTSNIAIIDWISFGYSVRQLDLGVLLFYLDENISISLTKYYIAKLSSRNKINNDMDPVILAKVSKTLAGFFIINRFDPICRNNENKSNELCKTKQQKITRFRNIINEYYS